MGPKSKAGTKSPVHHPPAAHPAGAKGHPDHKEAGSDHEVHHDDAPTHDGHDEHHELPPFAFNPCACLGLIGWNLRRSCFIVVGVFMVVGLVTLAEFRTIPKKAACIDTLTAECQKDHEDGGAAGTNRSGDIIDAFRQGTTAAGHAANCPPEKFENWCKGLIAAYPISVIVYTALSVVAGGFLILAILMRFAWAAMASCVTVVPDIICIMMVSAIKVYLGRSADQIGAGEDTHMFPIVIGSVKSLVYIYLGFCCLGLFFQIRAGIDMDPVRSAEVAKVTPAEDEKDKPPPYTNSAAPSESISAAPDGNDFAP